MLIGVITLMIDARLMREARRFVTVGSKGSMDRLNPLGNAARSRRRASPPPIFVLSVGLPLLTLFLSTVMKMPARFTLDNFTLDYWIGSELNTVALQTGILLEPGPLDAAWNSLAHRRRSPRWPRACSAFSSAMSSCARRSGRWRPSCGR